MRLLINKSSRTSIVTGLNKQKQSSRIWRWPKLAMSALLALAFWVLPHCSAFAQIGGSGWGSLPVNFSVQWPYNVPEDTRYWYTNGVYHCLVYSNDDPFEEGSTTL